MQTCVTAQFISGTSLIAYHVKLIANIKTWQSAIWQTNCNLANIKTSYGDSPSSRMSDLCLAFQETLREEIDGAVSNTPCLVCHQAIGLHAHAPAAGKEDISFFSSPAYHWLSLKILSLTGQCMCMTSSSSEESSGHVSEESTDESSYGSTDESSYGSEDGEEIHSKIVTNTWEKQECRPNQEKEETRKQE